MSNKDSSAMTSFYSNVDRDSQHPFLANIYLLKVNKRDTRITCEICKVTIKTSEQGQ